MSSINDIWASMNEDVPKHHLDINKLTNGKEKAKSKPKSKSVDSLKLKSTHQPCKHENREKATSPVIEIVSYDQIRGKIFSEIPKINDIDSAVRRKSLLSLHRIIFEESSLNEEVCSNVLFDLSKVLFQRFSDQSEKCRELSQNIIKKLFENSCDLVPVLAYYFPVLIQKLPGPVQYDDDLKIFVNDIESHEAYKRGKAVDRQDKLGVLETRCIQVVEPAEELRLLTCSTLYSLLQRLVELRCAPVLHPYFEDIILFIQAQLLDPFAEVKQIACNALYLLARVSDYEIGMKFYAVANVRALLPVLRHRHAKVRHAALSALHFCMIVPDRAKRKAAGSEAIQDFVGFREENILPIAAFYKSDVQINYLAELVTDSSTTVREALVELLTSLLTEIGDRFDHQTRLLPYLLDLMTDQVLSVSQKALNCLEICGKQYEEDHRDEILEKKQYGIDGDLRINLEKPLPNPFKERPKIGMRLYVRGISKRFLTALLNELTNWTSSTRLKSANLMKLIIILCEEHLTMDIHSTLNLLLKALKFAREEKDQELITSLNEVSELLGRYILPEVYVYHLIPRLRGEADLGTLYLDSDTKINIMTFFEYLLSGSRANQIVPYFDEIVTCLTDPFALSHDSVNIQSHVLQILSILMQKFQCKGKLLIESYYLDTGRLHTLTTTMRKILRHSLLQSEYKETLPASVELIHLIRLSDQPKSMKDVQHEFFTKQMPAIFTEEMSSYTIDDSWTDALAQHRIILKIAESPCCLLFIGEKSKALRTTFLDFLLHQFNHLNEFGELGQVNMNLRSSIFSGLLEFLITFLISFESTSFTGAKQNEEFNELLYNDQYPFIGVKGRHLDLYRSVCDEIRFPIFNLFTAIIFGNKSCQTVRANFQRLYILSIITKCEFPSEIRVYEETGQRDEGFVWLKYFTELATFDLEDGQTFSFIDENTVIDLFPNLVTIVFTTCVAPSNPVSLRYTGMALISQLAKKLTTTVKLEKVKSFHYCIKHFTSELMSTKMKWQPYIYFLMNSIISESSDELQEKACLHLLQNVQFILSEEESRENRHEEKTRFWSFTSLTRKLLQLLQLPSTELRIIEALDQLLGMVAVLEPRLFEKLVREECFSGATLTENVAGVVNDFLNHVETLCSLEK